jgi:hypothetical protein
LFVFAPAPLNDVGFLVFFFGFIVFVILLFVGKDRKDPGRLVRSPLLDYPP